VQITFENVSYSYPGGVPGGVKALDGISLCIEPGQTMALVGRNGSGKTTLARHINGLLLPTGGVVKVGDWRSDEHSPAQMARRAACTFQNPDEQLFRQTVLEEVSFGPRNLGFSLQRTGELVEQALGVVGLLAEASANPRDLGYSGRKLVTLASALAMACPILVLDEPTAGLDAREQARIAEVIACLKNVGRTLVMITHDMDFAAENLERFVLMNEGRVALDAPAAEFFGRRDVLAGEDLPAPQMVRLGERLGHDRPALTVEEFLNGETGQSGLFPEFKSRRAAA
jgi:energy-coupling factor transport system ATP-binding protein